MKVLSRFIVAKKVNEKKTASSGLILTGNDSNDMRYQKAEVIQCGDLVSSVKAGQIILFDKMSCHDIIIETERLSVLQEKDVVLVFD